MPTHLTPTEQDDLTIAQKQVKLPNLGQVNVSNSCGVYFMREDQQDKTRLQKR